MERNCFKSVERISTTAVVDTHHHPGIHADISTIITLASPSPLRLSPHRHFRAEISSVAPSPLLLRHRHRCMPRGHSVLRSVKSNFATVTTCLRAAVYSITTVPTRAVKAKPTRVLRLSLPISVSPSTAAPASPCDHTRGQPYHCPRRRLLYSTLGITTAPKRAVNLTAVNNCLRAAVYSTLAFASPVLSRCKSLTRHPYAGSRHF